MLVKTFGSAVFGVDATTITVEVNVCTGKDYFLVGLPDSAVKESWSRVESALRINKYQMPRWHLSSRHQARLLRSMNPKSLHWYCRRKFYSELQLQK